MSPDIQKLLGQIEQKLDWGSSDTWQSKDFDELNQRILNDTGVSLSASTLRRLWGKVEYNHMPSTTTLDALSKFAGFENWRVFVKQIPQQTDAAEIEAPSLIIPPKKVLVKKYWVAACLLILLVGGGIAGAFAFKKAQAPPVSLSSYTFSSKRLTHTLPNSVVFTYDASASPEDSVYIQQSWDPTTKTLVDKNLHQHTSVYYEPGFYDAKLMIGEKVVRQHRLLIPTDGWLGVINNKPVPVYIKQEDYIYKDSISFPVSGLLKKNIALQPNPPIVKFYNVGNFDSVSVDNFSFTADVKNEYSDGAAACQLTAIYLITDGNPIIIPLAVKGCSSEMNLMSVDQMISGKKADLSGFGVDFNKWAHVVCSSTNSSIKYFVNNQLAFECPKPKTPVHIVGVEFAFQGTGAVKSISLTDGGKQVFQSF